MTVDRGGAAMVWRKEPAGTLPSSPTRTRRAFRSDAIMNMGTQSDVQHLTAGIFFNLAGVQSESVVPNQPMVFRFWFHRQGFYSDTATRPLNPRRYDSAAPIRLPFRTSHGSPPGMKGFSIRSTS
jgi:hypothetical protein